MERPQTKERKPELLYIIGCEGINQERLYFLKLQQLINAIPTRKYNVLFDFAEPYGGNPRCVVERAVNKSIGKSNKAALFDYDNMQKQYEEAIDLAFDHSIEVGYTNYCFDLWLLLHKEASPPKVSHQDDYARYIKVAYGLSASDNIKEKKIVELILNQIELTDIKFAIKQAEILTEAHPSSAPHQTQRNHIGYYDNPDTCVHTVIKNIFRKTGINI